MNHDVFISYSSKEKSVADGVCHYLEDNGVKCWMAPRDIPVGTDYGDLIDEAIKSCRVVVLVYSQHSFISKWVKGEINVAFDEGKPIAPFRIDETGIKGAFRVMLNQMHWIDAYPSYADRLPDLLRSICGFIGREVPDPHLTIAVAEEEPKDATESEEHFLKVRCTLDCRLFVDREERATLKAGDITKVPLHQGEYLVQVTSLDGLDTIEQELNMPAADKLLLLDLLALQKERLAVEQQLTEDAAARKAQAEAERKTKEEAERKAKEEEARKAREEAERRERKEIERKARVKWYEAKRDEIKFRNDLEELRHKTEEEERKRREEERRRRSNQPFNVGGVQFTMVYVEGGEFSMSAHAPKSSNGFLHQVKLDGYYIGHTPVTQALWKKVMGSNPSYFKFDSLPVENVSWNDCQMFIRKLNTLTGKSFRLPTEAEWEYAARGGKKSHNYNYSGSNRIDDVAWYRDNSNNSTHPVGQKCANELGLFDMSGNVLEWCSDWYEERYCYYFESRCNPQGPSQGQYRVSRGGSWYYADNRCQISYRSYGVPTDGNANLGFRLAMSFL